MFLSSVWARADRPLDTPAQASMHASQPHIEVQLIAEKLASQSVRVGVLFKPDPGWHVYWSNPGDTGLAPSIEWQLPALFLSSDLHWPTPEFIPIAHLVNIGYHYDTLLWSELTVIPDSADDFTAAISGAAPVYISATLSWLVCKEACVPGSATLSADLSGISDEASKEAQRLFEREQSKLPTPLAMMDAAASIQEDHLALALYASHPVFKSASNVEVFVENTDVVTYGEPLHIRAENNVLIWRQRLNDYFQNPPATLSLVIVVEDQGSKENTAYAVNVPVL